MSPAHVVKVFLHAVALQVAEQTDAKWFQRRFHWQLLFREITILRNRKGLVWIGNRPIDIAQEIRRLCLYRLENATERLFGVAGEVSLGGLFVFFGPLVLFLGLLSFKNLGTWIAFPARFDSDRNFWVGELDSLLLEDLFSDRLKLGHLSFSVVNMELCRSVQFERRHISELKPTSSTDNLLRLSIGAKLLCSIGILCILYTTIRRIDHHFTIYDF